MSIPENLKKRYDSCVEWIYQHQGQPHSPAVIDHYIRKELIERIGRVEAELKQAREELAEARRKIEGFIEPIESLEECENCECLFHPDALQATADDVKLCPKCYEVCCREYEAIAPPEVKP